MELVRTDFQDGSYAKWIKDFQQRNPETISFSNRISTLNKGTIQIESLDPLKIKTSEITSHDFEQLGRLAQYYDYIKKAWKRSKHTSIVISVEGKLYTLMEDTKSTDSDTVILVVDTDDNADVKPLFIVK